MKPPFVLLRARTREVLLTAGCGAAGMLILAKSGAAADGVREGIRLCLEQAIPALFLFLVFADFLTLTGVAEIVAKPFGFLVRLFGIPRRGVAVFLLSLVGGYPVGPKMLGKMVRDGKLSPQTAEKMLCYTVNASPAFLIAGTALPCFGSVKVGAVMLGCQTASAILVGILARLLWGGCRETTDAQSSPQRIPVGDALVGAVSGGGRSMLAICGFILVFSVLVRAAESLPALAGWAGFLEITVGCSRLPGGSFWEMLILATAYTASGGVCVWMQAAAMLRGSGVRMRKFLLMRGVHLFLSLFLTIFFAKRLALPLEVFSTFSEALPMRGGATAGASVLLVIVCLMLLLCGGKCGKIKA